MSALFVTGAGTDIGKTHVSAALLRAWRARGALCDALKPVASGFDAQEMVLSDAGRLLAALGREVSDEEIARVCPWRFAAPLAPPLAARAEGASLAFADIVTVCRARIAAARGRLLIEGAGAVMSPLAEGHTNIDLIGALAAPVIFVSGDYLGAVSHTLTGLEGLARRGVGVRALVVSESIASAGLDNTCALLREHGEPTIRLIAARRNASDDTWVDALVEAVDSVI